MAKRFSLPFLVPSLVLVAFLAGCDLTLARGSQSTSTSTTIPALVQSVDIANFAFSPASVTIAKGTTVTWTNKDSASHTVTSTTGATAFASGTIAAGKSFANTFDVAGTWTYKCYFHPSMTATVIVSP